MSRQVTPRRLWTLPLSRRDSIGSSYHVLTFEAGDPLDVLPGQFAMVRGRNWGQTPLLPRPMSLLTGGDRPSILVKVVGEGTLRMAHAAVGEPFDLLAPLGRPWSPCPSDRRAVLVAGGVGVAPLLFLARSLQVECGGGSTAPQPLALYGGRTRADLPLHEELAAVTDLRIATEDGARGVKGRVTVLLERALAEHRAADRRVKVYTCGPDAMMATVAEMCSAAGVPCEVSLETPMACGYGVCLGCPIPRRSGGFLYACTEGPCVDGDVVDWARGHAEGAKGAKGGGTVG